MNINYPSISCVVIGINCEKTIFNCIKAIKNCSYPNILEIIYVDGGSKDRSVSIVKTVGEVKIIRLDQTYPTPGRGRNAGWQLATAGWVHFFDSDTSVEKDWLPKAVKCIGKDTGAIFGLRKESKPNKNWFHFIADLEWDKPCRKAKFFGGDILVRRSVLEDIGGYDENLVAGEEPELSVRIRAKGWQIVGVDAIMCYHDIDMVRLKQYFRRAVRSGCAYAEAGTKMFKHGEKAWLLKEMKILIKTTTIVSLIIFSIFRETQTIGLLALGLALSPLVKIPFFQRRFNISFKKALVYAVHCSIVVWLQFFGIIKYYFKEVQKLIL